MNQIVLEDLDPIIIKRLKARAQKHGRSLQTEVKTILQQVTEAETKKSNFSEDEIIQRKSDFILQQIARHAQARSKPVHPSATIPMRWSEEELVQVKARLKELKKGMSLGGLSIREAREEGRR